MKTNFSAAFIAIFAAATLSACATSGTPNKFAAAPDDSPLASFCKGEAVKVAARVGMRQSNNSSPLQGYSDMQDVRATVMADCLKNARVASR